MVEALLEKTMLGKLRVVDAHDLALRNASQKYAPQDVKDLATLGHGHLERDLHARYSEIFGARIESYMLVMDLLCTKDKYTFPTEVPFLFITDLVAAAYDAGPLQFGRSLLGDDPDLLDAFWRNALSQPWGQLHPHLQDPTVPTYASTVRTHYQ